MFPGRRLRHPASSVLMRMHSIPSTKVPFLQASRIGSEVVSSSNNLRNIPLKGKDIKSQHKMTATSSVKKLNKVADRQEV